MATSSICVYPLSPTYEVLHRLLYYLSLILSVLYPTPPPLVKGAFAYSLTYSATAALYAILTIALPQDAQVINLDIFGLWAVLSAACILILPLLSWTRHLQGASSRSARPIIRAWGVVVIVGAACIFSLLQSGKKTASATPATATATVLECSATTITTNTTYLRLRDPEHVSTADYDRVFGYLYGLVLSRVSPLVLPPLVFGGLACLITIVPKPVIAAAGDWGGISVAADTGTFTAFSALRNGFLRLRRLVLLLTPGFFIPVVVINEMYLLRDWPQGIPESENIYEVGQWGVYAGLGLVFAAAVINWIVGDAPDKGASLQGMHNDTVCIA